MLSVEFLTAVIEAVEDGVVACDADGMITLSNRAARGFYNIPEEVLSVGQSASFYSLYASDGKTLLSESDHPLRRALAGEHISDVKAVIASEKGGLREVVVSGHPLFEAGGGKLGAIIVMREVTGRADAHDALAHESRLMQALMDSIPDAIYFKDTESRFTRVNRHVPYRANIPPESVIGKTDFDFFVEDHAREAYESEQQIIRTGQPIINKEEKEIYPDGSVTWLSTTKVPIYDEEGRVAGIVGISRDVSDRKLAEEERMKLIQEQAARAEAEVAEKRAAFLAHASSILTSSLDYETTLQSVAEFSVPALADWCIVDVVEGDEIRRVAVAAHDPAKKLLLDELKRSHPPVFDSPQPSSVAMREKKAVLFTEFSDATLASVVRDAAHLDLARKLAPKSAIAVPLIAHGIVLGAITLARSESGRSYDQTDSALVEELARRAAMAIDNARLYQSAQEANRLKDEFLAMVSHELRTPLTPILGWANLLDNDSPNEVMLKNGLNVIKRNARAQTRIIDDLLDVSRIITGKLHLNITSFDPAGVISAAIDAVRSAADAKSIEIRAVFDPRCCRAAGDPDRLQQVVWNLLSNSIKFTPRTGRIDIHLKQVDSEIEIKVSDTGRGIRANLLPHIFDRFRQADSTTTREHGGLGLGLAIVRHLVELHGGTVRADSRGEGDGSTFTVKLPLVTRKAHQDG